jgi:hypothetical protein
MIRTANETSSKLFESKQWRWRIPKVTRPDINGLTSKVFRVDRVIFVRQHFLHQFSSRDNAAKTRAPSLHLSFIAKPEQRRAQFVAGLLTVDGITGCAEGMIAEMPFASPYCPYRAQIRRVHVQPRARFTVFPSMRVRSHASRLARAHHPSFSRILWWSFVAREASE